MLEKKIIGALGISIYSILGALSVYYFVERTVFTDIAFHLCYILKDNDYAIQNFRFVSFLTQSVPLFASRLNAPLEFIMQFYSLAFILLYGGVFAINLYVLKSKEFALTMLLFSTLMVTHTFYWIQSEFPQGIAIMLLYFGLLYTHIETKGNVIRKTVFRPVTILLLFTILFSHPLIIFPFSFICIFLIFNTNKNRIAYTKELFAFTLLYLIKRKFFNTEYDSQATEKLSNIKYQLLNFFDLESNALFFQYVLKDYFLLIICLISLVVFYFIKHNWLKLGLILLYFFGYLVLVNISYPDGAEQYYIENLYLPLSIFVAVPLAFELNQRLKVKYIPILIALLLLSRVFHIGITSSKYSERIEYLQGIMKETELLPNKKLIIKENPNHVDNLFMTWATSYEFWLLSTIREGSSRSIIITENPESLRWALPGTNNFITAWGAPNYNQLPNRYFKFEDNSEYVILKE